MYNNDKEKTNIDTIVKNETILLTEKGIVELFECTSNNKSLHVRNIFKYNELLAKIRSIRSS